jgi:hypothetical protein
MASGRGTPKPRGLSTPWKAIIAVTAATAVGLLTVSVIIPLYMDYHVKCYCAEARDLYAGDAVEALIAFLGSDRHTSAEKNHIIWTLGELRDPRAVPVLRGLLAHEASYGPDAVSLYEVRKALDKIEGRKRDPYFWK